MAFTIPSDLHDIVLYWWKIIDRTNINLDDLYNFLAFDLFLASIEKAKEMVQNAIKLKYLVEDKESESVQLSLPLEKEFIKWQNSAKEKVQNAKNLLNENWTTKMEITDNILFNVYMMDLLEINDLEKAGKIRSSAISFKKIDFDDHINGIIQEIGYNNKNVEIPFTIDISHQKILHKCNEYDELRKKQKKFCKHLGRVMIKLYASDKEITLNLLRSIVKNRNKWQFL